MRLTLRDDLVLVSVTVAYQGQEIKVPEVVVDTGSATTMLSADVVSQVGIVPELDDVLHVVRGVGGAEVVFSRRVERLQVGPQVVDLRSRWAG
jgi:predicted aspartyl protease